MEIKIAGPDDIDLLLPALLELRPHRSPEELRKMLLQQFGEGFQIIFMGDASVAYAVAGFRTIHFLFSGKTLYIDDLVTHSDHKRNGYAGALLDWLKEYAMQNGYDHISLDSGFHRKDAYRLYLNKGFEISSMHFSMKLK